MKSYKKAKFDQEMVIVVVGWFLGWKKLWKCLEHI